MGSMLMLFAEILVAVLLIATVVTSLRLSKRIARLQADEQAMRQTIVELMSATETAERAIAGLRNTLGECEKTLAERLRTAERYASDLAEQVEAGEHVMGRIMAAVDNNARTVAPREGAPAAPVEAALPPPANAAAAGPGFVPGHEAATRPVHRHDRVFSSPVPEPVAARPAPQRRVSDRISDAAELLAQRAVDRLGSGRRDQRGDAA